jgi:hypothetical protein
MVNAFVHLQKLYGTVSAKPAHVQPIHSEIIVLHAQPQEFGQTTNVFVKPQPFGTEINVFAQKEDLGQAVLNAQLQEDGIQLLINAFVTLHLSGTVKIVYAHNHISYIKEDVENVQLASNGPIINVNNVAAIIKISKFLPVFEYDQFIGLFYYLFIFFVFKNKKKFKSKKIKND